MIIEGFYERGDSYNFLNVYVLIISGNNIYFKNVLSGGVLPNTLEVRRQMYRIEIFINYNNFDFVGSMEGALLGKKFDSYVYTHGANPPESMTLKWEGEARKIRKQTEWLFIKYQENFQKYDMLMEYK